MIHSAELKSRSSCFISDVTLIEVERL